ncbi:MAG: chloride channel protein [Candidatus Micrarchaeia archaeon]
MLFRKFHIESLDYYKKWLVLGVIIGVFAGVASILFYYATEASEYFFMHYVMGYNRPLPLGEGGGLSYAFAILRPYLIPVAIVLGALASAWLVYRFAPETEGHGTDAVIKSYHEGKPIRARASIIKFVSASLLIGSGGSAGREGPIAQISASAISNIFKCVKLSKRDRQIILVVSIGAAIGSIFKSPFGGALFGAEVLYKRDIEGDVIFPAFVASTVGFIVYGAFVNYLPMFGINVLSAYAQTVIYTPLAILGFVLLGVVSGVFAKVYVKIFYLIHKKIGELKMSRYFKPALGAVGTAAIALLFPEVMGVGYGWVQLIISGRLATLPDLLGLPALLFVLALVFAKILATSFSIGSGGSGGVYAPGIFIGASVGLFTFLLLNLVNPQAFSAAILAPFVIVGMLSLFGAASKAPIAVAIMVVEMTGSILVIPVAMVSIAIAYALSGSDTIYISQKERRRA